MLTNATVRAARPRARPYKLFDGRGLYLHVTPSGHRGWRLRYRLEGREKLLCLGAFPELDLGGAREAGDAARAQLALGADPSLAVIQRSSSGFEDVARAWHAHQLARWSAVHADDVLASLARDVFPAIGAVPLAAIDAPAVLRVLRAVEARGHHETARRLRQRISAVFGFAMSEGLAQEDPAAIVTRALAPSAAPQRHRALLSIGPARELLVAVDQLDAAPAAKLASRFLALTAVRLAGVRGAAWSEFEQLDGPEPTWRIPAARMKLTRRKKADPAADHLVPLVPAAVSVLHAARAAFPGDGPVFPGRDGERPLGEGAIGALYRRAGFGEAHVPHGWRATFSTVLNERWPEDRTIIDRALAHAPKDKVEAAYNRAEHLDRRRNLFVRWAELLLG